MQENKTIDIVKCWKTQIIRFKEGYKYTYRTTKYNDDYLVTISQLYYKDLNEILALFTDDINAVVVDHRPQYPEYIGPEYPEYRKKDHDMKWPPYILVVVNVSPPEINSNTMCVFCFLYDDHSSYFYRLHACVFDDVLQRSDTFPMLDDDRKNLLLISNTGKRMAKIRIQ